MIWWRFSRPSPTGTSSNRLFPIGLLVRAFGYRRTLLVCLLGVARGSVATGLAPTLPVLVLAALLGAIGRAAIMPVSQAIVAASFVDDAVRRWAVSRIQSGGPLAATLGIPLLTAIAGEGLVELRLFRRDIAGENPHAGHAFALDAYSEGGGRMLDQQLVEIQRPVDRTAHRRSKN
jgi:MFS family permease